MLEPFASATSVPMRALLAEFFGAELDVVDLQRYMFSQGCLLEPWGRKRGAGSTEDMEVDWDKLRSTLQSACFADFKPMFIGILHRAALLPMPRYASKRPKGVPKLRTQELSRNQGDSSDGEAEDSPASNAGADDESGRDDRKDDERDDAAGAVQGAAGEFLVPQDGSPYTRPPNELGNVSEVSSARSVASSAPLSSVRTSSIASSLEASAVQTEESTARTVEEEDDTDPAESKKAKSIKGLRIRFADRPETDDVEEMCSEGSGQGHQSHRESTKVGLFSPRNASSPPRSPRKEDIEIPPGGFWGIEGQLTREQWMSLLCKAGDVYTASSNKWLSSLVHLEQRVISLPPAGYGRGHGLAWCLFWGMSAACELMNAGSMDESYSVLSAGVAACNQHHVADGDGWKRPLKIVFLVLIAQHYRRQAKSRAAHDMIKRAISACLTPNDPAIALLRPAVLVSAGSLLITINKPAEAQKWLDRALSEITDSLANLEMWKRQYDELQKWAGTSWSLDEAVWKGMLAESVSMDLVAVYYNLALAHSRQVHPEDCVTALRNAVTSATLALSPMHCVRQFVCRPVNLARDRYYWLHCEYLKEGAVAPKSSPRAQGMGSTKETRDRMKTIQVDDSIKTPMVGEKLKQIKKKKAKTARPSSGGVMHRASGTSVVNEEHNLRLLIGTPPKSSKSSKSGSRNGSASGSATDRERRVAEMLDIIDFEETSHSIGSPVAPMHRPPPRKVGAVTLSSHPANVAFHEISDRREDIMRSKSTPAKSKGVVRKRKPEQANTDAAPSPRAPSAPQGLGGVQAASSPVTVSRPKSHGASKGVLRSGR